MFTKKSTGAKMEFTSQIECGYKYSGYNGKKFVRLQDTFEAQSSLEKYANKMSTRYYKN